MIEKVYIVMDRICDLKKYSNYSNCDKIMLFPVFCAIYMHEMRRNWCGSFVRIAEK